MTCTNGFPDLTAPMGSLFPRGDGVTRIIPEMNISCHGTLSGWTVVGNTGPGSVNDPFPKLKVFREINRNSQTYSFVGEVDLGKCGDGFAPINENNFYTCSLSEEKQIPTQPNDIIGLFLPDLSNSAFRLSFAISTTAPTNYIFQMADVRSNISISSSPTVKNTPQLNLEITTGILYKAIEHINTTQTMNNHCRCGQ